MFVRVKKFGGYEHLYLVENVREGGRQGQRVFKLLGRRDEVEDSGLLLIASAARRSRRSIVLSSFYRRELAETRRRSIGRDLVFGHLWRATDCEAVLRRYLAGRPEVEQDGRCAPSRTAARSSIDSICRALRLTLPLVFREVPTDKASIIAE
jgi:hypothetical protein